MKNYLLRFLFFIGILGSCITPKSARQLKKSTATWRESPIVFHAYGDSPMSGVFLTLRENGKFEHTCSGMFQSFEAGDWTRQQDTIKLVYTGIHGHVESNRKAIIDRNTSTVYFEGDSTPVMMRLRIMTNKLW